MSSDTFIAYFGLRFEVGPGEVDGIELKSDARVVAARRAGLKYYFGNFGGAQEKYLLFVGTQIGVLGAENSQEISLSLDDARISFDATREKLKRAGLSGGPALHLTWQPDI